MGELGLSSKEGRNEAVRLAEGACALFEAIAQLGEESSGVAPAHLREQVQN